MPSLGYRDELEQLATAFRAEGAHVEIRGTGLGSFLVVEFAGRGAELYWGDDGVYIVDPALGQDLLGEVEYASVQSAVDAIWSWLKEAVRPMGQRIEHG